MNARMRKVVYGALIVIGLIVLGVVWYSAKTNLEFWKINVSNGFTMLWAVGFTFVASQAFSRYQKKSDIIISMIKDLLVALDESKTCVVIPENGKETLLMQKRQISVYISLLKNHAKKFGIEREVAFVAKRFKEYETLLGDHIDNLEYLAQSQKELAKPIKGMTVKLYEIMLKI